MNEVPQIQALIAELEALRVDVLTAELYDQNAAH